MEDLTGEGEVGRGKLEDLRGEGVRDGGFEGCGRGKLDDVRGERWRGEVRWRI